jgi:hypothetical protein
LLRSIWRHLRPPTARTPNWVSVGTFCHAAAALRQTGLRGWSGPFDWIFSTPALVADCIEDDFREYLDPANLRTVSPDQLVPGSQRQCRHVLFEERYGLPTLFNHHDPASSAKDARALRRAVDRFRSALAGSKPQVFFMLSDRPRLDADLARLERLLAGPQRRHRFAVLTLEVASEPGTTMSGDPGGRFGGVLRLTTASTGVRFANPEDDERLAQAILDLSQHHVSKPVAGMLSRGQHGRA